MSAQLLKFPVTLTPPPDDRFRAYDTYVWATTSEGAHLRVQEIMEGHEAVNPGFWRGWCYKIGTPTVR